MSMHSLRFRLGIARLNMLAPLHFILSRSELRSLLSPDHSGAKLLELQRRYQGHGLFRNISAWQVESEYCRLVDWVSQQRPRVILEIGTHAGGTLFAWSRIASEMVVSVDLPGGIHGGGYPGVKRWLYREFVSDRPGVSMQIFRADSHSESVRDQVKEALGGRSIDFLFIDGDHTYQGVSRDFQLWSTLVTPGGHVAFHDILPQVSQVDCGVDRLWSELKCQYPSFEIIADPNQAWAGIGVLQIKPS